MFDTTFRVYSGTEHFETVLDVLDSMQVKYDFYDVSGGGEYELEKYENVVVSFIDLEKFASHLPELMTWVGNGGPGSLFPSDPIHPALSMGCIESLASFPKVMV